VENPHNKLFPLTNFDEFKNASGISHKSSSEFNVCVGVKQRGHINIIEEGFQLVNIMVKRCQKLFGNVFCGAGK